jgi:sigma-B regulation protein RsbU (phosphoserine phosphatase)
LSSVNRELLKLAGRRMFVTVLYGVLHPATGEFVYARAGHEPPVLAFSGDAALVAVLSSGRMLGLFEDAVLADSRLTVPPGGSLVLYTDGVIETRDSGRDFFGEQRLEDLVRQTRDGTAQAVCDAIMAAVAAHAEGLAQQDDITVVCAQRMPRDGSGPQPDGAER